MGEKADPDWLVYTGSHMPHFGGCILHLSNIHWWIASAVPIDIIGEMVQVFLADPNYIVLIK